MSQLKLEDLNVITARKGKYFDKNFFLALWFQFTHQNLIKYSDPFRFFYQKQACVMRPYNVAIVT